MTTTVEEEASNRTILQVLSNLLLDMFQLFHSILNEINVIYLLLMQKSFNQYSKIAL